MIDLRLTARVGDLDCQVI